MFKQFYWNVFISLLIWLTIWSIHYYFIAPGASIGKRMFMIIAMAVSMTVFIRIPDTIFKKIFDRYIS